MTETKELVLSSIVKKSNLIFDCEKSNLIYKMMAE